MIVEIGFDVTDLQFVNLIEKLREIGYPFYIEPPREFKNLEELECQCEEK